MVLFVLELLFTWNYNFYIENNDIYVLITRWNIGDKLVTGGTSNIDDETVKMEIKIHTHFSTHVCKSNVIF